MKRRLPMIMTLACISTLMLLLTAPVSARPAPESANVNLAPILDDPEGTFEEARVVHNVTVDGEKGMRVHAKIHVRYGLGTPCQLVAYFYNPDGSPVEANEKKYSSRDGAVSAYINFTPAYDPAVYNDLQLFIPYSAMNLDSGGEYDLKFYLALYDKSGQRFFGKSGWFKFTVTMP